MSGLAHLHGLYPESKIEILETESQDAQPPFQFVPDTDLPSTQVLPLNFQPIFMEVSDQDYLLLASESEVCSIQRIV